jgi:hypothetical protein
MESSMKTDSWMTHGIVNENLDTPDLEIITENFIKVDALNRHRQLIHGWHMESSMKIDLWMTHGIVNENLDTPDLEIISKNFVKADTLNR